MGWSSLSWHNADQRDQANQILPQSRINFNRTLICCHGKQARWLIKVCILLYHIKFKKSRLTYCIFMITGHGEVKEKSRAARKERQLVQVYVTDWIKKNSELLVCLEMLGILLKAVGLPDTGNEHIFRKKQTLSLEKSHLGKKVIFQCFHIFCNDLLQGLSV